MDIAFRPVHFWVADLKPHGYNCAMSPFADSDDAAAVFEDFEQVVAGLGGQGFEAPVVEDEQVDGDMALGRALSPSGGPMGHEDGVLALLRNIARGPEFADTPVVLRERDQNA